MFITSNKIELSEKNTRYPSSWNINFQRQICYDIIKTRDLFNPLNKTLLIGGRQANSRRFVVIDDFIYGKYKNEIKNYFQANAITTKIVAFNCGEHNKNVDNYIDLFQALDNFQIDRRGEPIIAIGGGVLTDIVGFVSSSYRRGVPHIKVPTTLMGYVDASVGIKTGINFNDGKNRMGTFEAPKAVILDDSFLKTLPHRHIVNGVGEILKLAVIKDRNLLTLLEEEGQEAIQSKFQTRGDSILNRSIQGMIEELEPNLFEDNLERSVDFGHTFSPALEMHDIGNLLHGEAVAIDTMFSVILAFRRSLISLEDKNRVLNLMKKLKLPYCHPGLKTELLWKGLIERTHHRDGQQRVPLPSPLGKCIFVNDVTKEEIKSACKMMEKLSCLN